MEKKRMEDKLKYIASRLTENATYREIPAELVEYAKEHGIVIVYGASDDLMEFDGAIYEEIDAYEGTTAYLDENGLIENECEEDCPYFKEKLKNAKHKIKAVWCGKDRNHTWSYDTDILHETFEILNNDEKYCLGIVFYKESLRS